MTSGALKYHRNAVALLDEPPEFSARAAACLSQRECELGIRFPESLREWYLLKTAVDLLRKHSNTDHPVDLDNLGQPFPDWYGGGPQDFVRQGLVVFMCENQGVCNWAFRLDGSPDPEVVVEVDTAPNDQWLHCADTFSTFVYCQIWDHVEEGFGVSSQELEFAEADLLFLKANFLQRPSTHGWPGETNYRFEAENGRILIWQGSDQADWFVSASSAPRLRTLLAQVWHCGSLADTLYGLSSEAEEVLKNLRGAEPRPKA